MKSLHSLTFGGGYIHMRRSAERLNHEIDESGFFKTSKLVTDKSLKKEFPEFSQELRCFRKNIPDKGFGRWLWKPYLIQQRIDELKDNSVLLYIDAGCHINLYSKEAQNRLSEYVEIAHQTGGLAMQLLPNEGGQGNLAEECFNSIDLMNRVGLNPVHRKTLQVQATLLFIKVDNDGKEFIKTWLDIAREDDYQYLREDLIQEVTPNFRDYRWDQSIFSALFKQTEFTSLPDETWWGPNWQEEGDGYPIWAMRHRSGARPFSNSLANLPDKMLTRLNL